MANALGVNKTLPMSSVVCCAVLKVQEINLLLVGVDLGCQDQDRLEELGSFSAVGHFLSPFGILNIFNEWKE